MLTISMRLAIALRTLLQHAPTNVLLHRLQSRDGLKWGVPFMLLGGAYLFATTLLTSWLHHDAPAWFNVFVFFGIWNGLKFIAFGPISVILLTRARIIERRQRVHRGATKTQKSDIST
jgi:hypothetical protein